MQPTTAKMKGHKSEGGCGVAGDRQAAASELGAQLRDRVEFERTTIWKDMVGMERRRGEFSICSFIQFVLQIS